MAIRSTGHLYFNEWIIEQESGVALRLVAVAHLTMDKRRLCPQE